MSMNTDSLSSEAALEEGGGSKAVMANGDAQWMDMFSNTHASTLFVPLPDSRVEQY
jgi:hypothetical protein